MNLYISEEIYIAEAIGYIFIYLKYRQYLNIVTGQRYPACHLGIVFIASAFHMLASKRH